MRVMNWGFTRSLISLWMSPSCQTLSNARSMSRKTAIVHSLRLAKRVESVWSSSVGFIEECCERNPNCCDGIMWFISRKSFIRLVRIFSKIFPVIFKREMGL